MKNLFNMKKSDNNNTKTAVQMTASQKPTTTVANISGKVKTAAFGVATGAGVAGSMMLQNERSIRNRKARAEYHKKVEVVCTVAVGAAVVGATAAVVQGIFDPIVDVSMLEIEPASYLELNNKAVELDGAGTCSDSEEVETVEAEIVPEQEAVAPASAPKAEQPIVEATATEQPASAPADPAPVAPQAEQPAAPAPKDATPASAPAAPDPAVAAPTASAPADPAPAPVAPADPTTKQSADPAPAAAPKAEQPKSKNKNANAAK